MSVRAYACCRSAWPGIGCRRSSFPYWRCSRQGISTSRVCTLWRVLTPGRVRHWLLAIRANACRACRHCWTIIGRIRGSPSTAISAHKHSMPSSTFNPPTTWQKMESWRPRPPTPSMNSPTAEYFQLYGRVRGFEAGPAGEVVCRGLPDSRGNHISLAACRACLRQQPAPNSLYGPGLSAALVAANSAAAETLLAQARGWAAKFLCIIFIALIATLLDLLTEVFRTMSGRRAFGDPSSQETQPQMRAGYGS